MPSPRRLYAVTAGAALALAPLVGAALPAAAATSTVTLVGSFQSELGCSADWQADCDESKLSRVGDTTAYAKSFSVPAGSYNFKVAINDTWDVNYGAGGALNGADIPLVLEGPATLDFTYDDVSHLVSFTPRGISGGTTKADAKLAQSSLRSPLTKERFYFLMADRFANGRTDNDTGGLTGGPLTTGFDPTHKGFYHGGDLAGVTSKLDYIKGLGTTAIWLTPSFKNKPVQGKPGEESAGYHGYWITDFTQIDPHLGTNAEMKALIAAAHKKGMKVFFDIITNHTADVIDYKGGTYTYRSKKSSPYTDADGTAFDDRDYVNTTFPQMDPATSFPYVPFLHAGDEDAKTPAWLNNPLMYHNRGDSTFAGESSTYGDFIGLDDLFTERPEVVDGMGEIYKEWVDFGIDGFRIDTVKHVNLEFWQKFVPDILAEAKAVRNDDFFAFGEVYDGNPAVMSEYTTRGRLQATLDFGFQQQGVDFAKGNPANVLADFFAKDDWYTDADSNAYQLPTFLGNHDMGRVAMFLREAAGGNEAQHLARVKFADSLMFATRGNPVTYYGDEQGFIGTGGDQLAREDMFASKVDIYNTEEVLAGPEGSRDRFDTSHPLYEHIRALSKVRAKHPALADGAQISRYAADGAGIFAFSRIDAKQNVEYVVAANNATTPSTATFPTWSRGKGVVLTPVFGTDTAVKPTADGSVTVKVPPLTVSIWRANKSISTAGAAPTVEVSTGESATVAGRAQVSADVSASTFAQATFLYRPVGTQAWRTIGTDDNAPFRVFHDVAGMPVGSVLEYRAVVRDAGGRVAADGTWASVVADVPPPAPAEIGDPPATQPSTVGVPGTHNSEMGCSKDWDELCDASQLVLDPADKIWKKAFTLPAGPYAYKAALDKAWTENYGAKGEREGSNISYETLDGKVRFYYDPTTHWATSDEETAILTAAGSFQSELGCPGDWAADCMRPWLQDKDGDGVYSWATTRIPAGTWKFKVTHGLSWEENYGDGGVHNGGDITLTVPADGAKTSFTYDSATHLTSVTSEASGTSE
jgi:YD repeat-containing protein